MNFKNSKKKILKRISFGSILTASSIFSIVLINDQLNNNRNLNLKVENSSVENNSIPTTLNSNNAILKAQPKDIKNIAADFTNNIALTISGKSKGAIATLKTYSGFSIKIKLTGSSTFKDIGSVNIDLQNINFWNSTTNSFDQSKLSFQYEITSDDGSKVFNSADTNQVPSASYSKSETLTTSGINVKVVDSSSILSELSTALALSSASTHIRAQMATRFA